MSPIYFRCTAFVIDPSIDNLTVSYSNCIQKSIHSTHTHTLHSEFIFLARSFIDTISIHHVFFSLLLYSLFCVLFQIVLSSRYEICRIKTCILPFQNAKKRSERERIGRNYGTITANKINMPLRFCWFRLQFPYKQWITSAN